MSKELLKELMSKSLYSKDKPRLILNGYDLKFGGDDNYFLLEPIVKDSLYDIYKLELRITKYSDDDIFLNGLVNDESKGIEGIILEGAKGHLGNYHVWILRYGCIRVLPLVIHGEDESISYVEYYIHFEVAVRTIRKIVKGVVNNGKA